MNQFNSSLPSSVGKSPFDALRKIDTYGREYWTARTMGTCMGYPRWQHFEPVINRAMAAARNVGDSAAVFTEVRENPSSKGGRPSKDYRLTRAAAYYVAMNGDPSKPEVAAAQAYFVHRTREAELQAITNEQIQRTALARAREMVDYRTFRDMMVDTASDYEPSSRATRQLFAVMQNRLYRHVTGLDAGEILAARTQLQSWAGQKDGKPEPGVKSRERRVAKNYLTEKELGKLDRLVGRLCLLAEDISEDGVHLPLASWVTLVDNELDAPHRRLLAA